MLEILTQVSLELVLRETSQPDLPVQRTWRLNSRHSGLLTGLDKAEIWRSTYHEQDRPYYEAIMKDPRFKDDPDDDHLRMIEIRNILSLNLRIVTVGFSFKSLKV